MDAVHLLRDHAPEARDIHYTLSAHVVAVSAFTNHKMSAIQLADSEYDLVIAGGIVALMLGSSGGSS